MTKRMKKSNHRRKHQAGQAMVESALVMLIFLVMIFGIMDFGRMVWSYGAISHGAREATRYAIVHGTDSGHAATTPQIQAIVTSNTPGLDTSNVSTAVSFSPNQSSGSTVKVVVSYKFYVFTPYIPVDPITMKSTSQMVIYQ